MPSSLRFEQPVYPSVCLDIPVNATGGGGDGGGGLGEGGLGGLGEGGLGGLGEGGWCGGGDGGGGDGAPGVVGGGGALELSSSSVGETGAGVPRRSPSPSHPSTPWVSHTHAGHLGSHLGYWPASSNTVHWRHPGVSPMHPAPPPKQLST